MEHDVLGALSDDNSVDLDATPADSPTEEVQDDTTPSSVEDKPEGTEQPQETEEEPNVPFHEHPRFKELVEEKNSYKQQIEEFKTQLEELQGQVKPAEPAQTSNSTVPPEFVELFGVDDPKAYELFQKVAGSGLDENTMKSKFDELISEREKQRQEEEQLTQELRKQYDDTAKKLAEEHGFSKAQFRKWFAENPIYKAAGKSEDGDATDFDFDWERGAKLFAAMNPPKSRSEVAKTSTDLDPGDQPRYKALKDLSDASWDRL